MNTPFNPDGPTVRQMAEYLMNNVLPRIRQKIASVKEIYARIDAEGIPDWLAWRSRRNRIALITVAMAALGCQQWSSQAWVIR